MSFRSHLNLSSICLISLSLSLFPVTSTFSLTHANYLGKFRTLQQPPNSKKRGQWIRFASHTRSTVGRKRGRENSASTGVNEWVVVAWSTRTTKTNDDSMIGAARWAGKRRTMRPNVNRKWVGWEETQFIESRGLIAKLLAIPIGHANFRQQYRTCLRTTNLFPKIGLYRFIHSKTNIIRVWYRNTTKQLIKRIFITDEKFVFYHTLLFMRKKNLKKDWNKMENIHISQHVWDYKKFKWQNYKVVITNESLFKYNARIKSILSIWSIIRQICPSLSAALFERKIELFGENRPIRYGL